MSKTKMLTDPSVPRLDAIADDALVTVADNTGKVSTIEFSKLKSQIKESMVIGGRNLLSMEFRNVCPAFAKENTALKLIANQDAYFCIKLACLTSEIEVGKEYTISFRVEGLEDGDKWTFTSRSGAGFSINLKNGVNSGTFIMSDNFIKDGVLAFDDSTRLFPNGLHNAKLSQFKLERGNMATGWSLAPEEILSKFGTS